MAVLEGNEPLGMSAGKRENNVDLYLSFAVPLATGEEPQSVSNNVAAELAMALGDGDTAVREAERAVDLAAACGSARHRVKSRMVLAAAL